jgi:GxxExxY protein
MNLPPSHRDTELEDINRLTQRIIACAIEVHRVLGPGLLEQVYETAMCIEMDDVGVTYCRQVRLPAYYKGRPLGEYKVDLIVSVERMSPVFEAQLLNYLRLTAKRVGLLINFNTRLVKEGITRRIL